jgi:hypothetical protein
MARSLTTEEWENEFDNHSLLLAEKWENKRKGRWQRNSRELVRKKHTEYKDRFTLLRAQFPETFVCLDGVREAIEGGVHNRAQLENLADYRRLPLAFRDEVIYRYPARR